MFTLRNSLLLLLLVSILPACSSTQPSSQDVSNKGLIQLSAKGAPLKAPSFMVRGTLTLGKETKSFTPCGSNQQYWVDIPKDAYRQAVELGNTPYQPMYAELIGHIEASSAQGFESGYPAIFVVSNINMITTNESPKCQQAYNSTKASGHQPFWSVMFTKNQLHLKQPNRNEQALAIVSTDITATERVYHLEQGKLTLKNELCSNKSDKSLYGWTAQLENNNDKNTGCATLANKDATQFWVGKYVAQSTKTEGFSVEINLFADHRATTSYHYSQGLPTRESGYWQQLNDKQVQVVMTLHQGQRLIAERVFTLQGQQITAEKEKVSGRVYPIANGGLSLFRMGQ